jgi:hypothetical protein
MSLNYNITITGGTSPGPYTIYYNVINNNNNIALKYLYFTPATNISLSELTSGYYVTVPDDTTVIYLYNESCGASQSFPVEAPKPTYDFCIFIENDFAIHFNPNGLYDGYETWISDDSIYQIIWDSNLNKWKISGGTLPYQVVSNSSYPPLTGWYSLGGGPEEILSAEGNCNISNTLGFNSIINQPTCECDGVITFQPSGGVPPYQYSIDNGVSYSSSAIFNNLCSGTYTLVLRDSNLNTIYSTEILTNILQPVTYSVTILPVVNTITNTPSLKTNQISATLNVSPPLPQGVSLTLNLSHSNVFKTSPTPTQSTLTTNTILNINGIPQAPPLSNFGTSLDINTIPGCQNKVVYITTETDVWSNITINDGDVVILNTTTSVFKTLDECLIGESLDSYTITTATIGGCSCCTVEIINTNLGSSGNLGGSSIGGITT